MYEEKEDKGKLWYRHTPDGDWKPFTDQMYMDRINELMERIRKMSVQ